MSHGMHRNADIDSSSGGFSRVIERVLAHRNTVSEYDYSISSPVSILITVHDTASVWKLGRGVTCSDPMKEAQELARIFNEKGWKMYVSSVKLTSIVLKERTGK